MWLGAQTSRSWFAVFNNPQKHGYGKDIEDLKERAEHVCNRLMAEWCVTDIRVGAWAYCVKHYVGCFPVYADGDGERKRPIAYRKAITDEELAQVPEDLEHVHMVLEDDKPMAFGTVKNTYAIGMHFEGTKGTKKEAEDYIAKTGDYDERPKKELGQPWEEVIYVARHGDIRGKQGQRSVNDEIKKYLDQGMKPDDILAMDFKYYARRADIKQAYVDRRIREVPFERDVKVFWHYGASGSGKSYSREVYEKAYGADEIFYMTNYSEHSRFDGYIGQKVLWLEDFKGEIRFGDLLRMLDKYKVTFTARYANIVGIWSEVHITSVYHPIGIYNRLIERSDRGVDIVDQLLRRIFCIMYHYKVVNGDTVEYKSYPFSPNTTVTDMQSAIEKRENQKLFAAANWTQLNADDGEELPF